MTTVYVSFALRAYLPSIYITHKLITVFESYKYDIYMYVYITCVWLRTGSGRKRNKYLYVKRVSYSRAVCAQYESFDIYLLLFFYTMTGGKRYTKRKQFYSGRPYEQIIRTQYSVSVWLRMVGPQSPLLTQILNFELPSIHADKIILFSIEKQ